MEKYEESIQRSQRFIKVADHMLTMTYPLVQDPKLLISILENIFLSLTNAMGSILYWERKYKRIPPFHDNFESKFRIFKNRCAEKYHIKKEHLKLMRDVKEFLYERKNSSVEFCKKNKFVICSDDYHTNSISAGDIKGYLAKAKVFIQQISSIMDKNERIFGRR